jgi:hypothetical protein
MRLTYFTLIFVLTLSGCCVIKSPREQFLDIQSETKRGYIRLYEVSIESLQAHEDEVLRITTNIVYSLNHDIEQSSESNKCRLTAEKLDRIQKIAEGYWKEDCQRINGLKEIYRAKTDSVLFYDYMSDTNQESGWVVIRGKKIVGKIILEKGAAPF